MENRPEALIEEEYKTWRKNVKYMYDLVYTQTLKWPSPTVQWFPEVERKSDATTSQRILLTTFTDQREQEHVLIGRMGFPDIVDEDEKAGAQINFDIVQSMPVPAEINKAKYCPISTNLLACKTEEADVLVYDYTRHASFNSDVAPDERLRGHSEGGFALDWNKINFGHLVTGGRDKAICHFDINSGLIRKYGHHSEVVNAVSCSAFNPAVFASVSDDCSLVVVDTRNEEAAVVARKAHASSIEFVDFSPFRAELIATASSDKTIRVWDTRNTRSPVAVLRGHKGDVMTVKWSLHYESILASGSKDRRINIWDLNKSNAASGDASNELVFIHGGHANTVADFDWNPAEPIEIVSVCDSNFIHVWKIPIEDYI
ncbi:HAT2 [Enterospora canceri]|uniref:HAT2 n=1 Tax=Enterospora canceri TaxID=1081671 RepID=A0A1Y1S508_9MICR|nr:HAT2 [Enterospora canceri]